jgi:hypothetical protein
MNLLFHEQAKHNIFCRVCYVMIEIKGEIPYEKGNFYFRKDREIY